jgi:hypothetical protein
MMRRAPRERAATTLAAALFGARTWLLTGPNLGLVPPSVSNYVATGCYFIGAVLLVWVGYRLWLQAAPPSLPPPEFRPSAVKGPMAFGPEDGVLFQRLGRDHELAQLLSLTLNDQILLIVVMGESGVGKTSLLRAGLPFILQSQHVQSIYWEAVPTDSPARLLHAALSTYCVPSGSSGMEVSPPLGSDPLGGCSPRDVVPHLKPLGHELAIGRGRQPVASRAAVWGEHTLGGQEPLGRSGRLEPLPPSFALTRRLRGVLGACGSISSPPSGPASVAPGYRGPRHPDRPPASERAAHPESSDRPPPDATYHRVGDASAGVDWPRLDRTSGPTAEWRRTSP